MDLIWPLEISYLPENHPDRAGKTTLLTGESNGAGFEQNTEVNTVLRNIERK